MPSRHPLTPVGTFNGCHVSRGAPVGDGNLIDSLREIGQLTPAIIDNDTLSELICPRTIEEAESALFYHADIARDSLPFDPIRERIREALRAIVGYVFQNYSLPTNPGPILDIGCGPSGEMVHGLFPRTIDRSVCYEIDGNPRAIEEHHRRHPAAQKRAQRASYLNLRLNNELSLITGLSSLDSTSFMGQAILKIRNALKEGGFLFHLQDVSPSFSSCLEEMIFSGEPFPYHVECLDPEAMRPNGSLTGRHSLDKIVAYRTQKGPLPVAELFRRRLGRAIQGTPGLELIANEWITAHSIAPFPGKGGVFYSGAFSPHSMPGHQMVSGVVTIARKKAA
ncbi:MAG: class I SAM-dependent methyltransferase [Candidatus Gracilibacteria bacterium]